MRILREPLVHFLLGGAALFLLHGRLAGEAGGEARRDRIVIGEARVASLAAGFERTWRRPPTRAELDSLVDEFVTEEILYREALALGLDRDDLVVRRRMRQKMEFLGAGRSAAPEPSDAALRRYLAAHPERFRRPARVSFRQVFLDPEQPGPVAELRAAALLARLRTAGPSPSADAALGDPTLLPPGLDAATPQQVADRFGSDFAEALAAVATGEWAGPIASGFGLHLVHVSARAPERWPGLDEVRPAVEREWRAERRREAERQWQSALRERYEVAVRMPSEAGPAVAARTP